MWSRIDVAAVLFLACLALVAATCKKDSYVTKPVSVLTVCKSAVHASTARN